MSESNAPYPHLSSILSFRTFRLVTGAIVGYCPPHSSSPVAAQRVVELRKKNKDTRRTNLIFVSRNIYASLFFPLLLALRRDLTQ